MGFPSSSILRESNASMSDEFVCPICLCLCEDPLVTPCFHVYCKNCFDEWFLRDGARSNCPKCNARITAIPPRMQQANPLAWRVLSRIQIECPLKDQGCSWSGDYANVSSHLTASDSHHSPGIGGVAGKSAAMQSAEALKQQGNQRFEARCFKEAVQLYSKAITLDPAVASFYTNRAAAWLMLGAFTESAVDCRKALELEPENVRAHSRLAKALVESGELHKALQHLSEVIQRGIATASELQIEHARLAKVCAAWDQGIDSLNQGDFESALQCLTFVEQASSSAKVLVMSARAAVGCGLCDRAIMSTLKIVKADDTNAEAFAVRGRALFFTGDVDQGVKHLRESLRLDPDQGDTARTLKVLRVVSESMNKGKDAANTRRFDLAVSLFSEALCAESYPSKAPILASLYSQRAAAYLRLGQHQEALDDCQQEPDNPALRVRDDCKDAWISRAECLVALDRAAEARAEMTDLLKMYEHDSLVRHWHDKADFEVRRKARPDYYAVLRVSHIATEGEIKMAYKARALECHPDKAGLDDASRIAAESSFKCLGEALEVLGDSTSRKL